MVHFVPGFKMPLLALAVFLSLVPWMEESEGQPQLIGSSETIRAPVGGDVTLPCVVLPQINMEDLTVMWWRPDIPVDPNWYVHLYHENQHQEAQTMQSYVGRTEMFADGLKLGNLSLQIRNLKPSDDGRYICIIPNLPLDTTIKLEVFEPISDDTLTTTQFQGNLQTPDPKNETDVKVGRHNWKSWQLVLSICILVVVAVGAGGCFLKYKYQTTSAGLLGLRNQITSFLPCSVRGDKSIRCGIQTCSTSGLKWTDRGNNILKGKALLKGPVSTSSFSNCSR